MRSKNLAGFLGNKRMKGSLFGVRFYTRIFAMWRMTQCGKTNNIAKSFLSFHFLNRNQNYVCCYSDRTPLMVDEWEIITVFCTSQYGFDWVDNRMNIDKGLMNFPYISFCSQWFIRIQCLFFWKTLDFIPCYRKRQIYVDLKTIFHLFSILFSLSKQSITCVFVLFRKKTLTCSTCFVGTWRDKRQLL